MKGLFLVYHGFSAHSGISKKIAYQCEALRRNGVEMQLCHLDIAPDGTQRRIAGKTPIRDFGRGIGAKLLKRFSFGDIVRHVREQGIGFIYIRHDFNANPATVRLVRQLHRTGARIVVEIPTYPYDAEFADASLAERLSHVVDQLFRRRMCRWVDRIVTFSDETVIFGCPTIRISNGIDFHSVQVKNNTHRSSHELNLLAVANIHAWHGFDRVIEGLRNYYAAPHDCVVRLRIAGDGVESLIADYHRRIDAYNLKEYASLIGTRSGAELDEEFEWCDMGIASLARHRSGITDIKTLKNREYAARGIPFVYSERDSDFDTQPYVMKAPADDSPLDIAALVRFFDAVSLSPAQIRATVEPKLSWDEQMKQVLQQLDLL